MAWHIHQLVLGLHILAAIAWAGGILFVGWGVFPTLKKFDYIEQQHILKTLMETVHMWLTAFGAFVIVTGILLGTVLGPIKQWDTLWQTSYGHKFLFALLLGIFALGWGAKVSYPLTSGTAVVIAGALSLGAAVFYSAGKYSLHCSWAVLC